MSRSFRTHCSALDAEAADIAWGVSTGGDGGGRGGAGGGRQPTEGER